MEIFRVVNKGAGVVNYFSSNTDSINRIIFYLIRNVIIKVYEDTLATMVDNTKLR